MYKVSAIYHSGDDTFFDLEHYFNVHVPLALKQMALGNLKFIKREIVQNVKDMFDPSKTGPVFIISYILESKQDVEEFVAFMKTDLIQPLIEDVPKYTNCEVEWTISEVEELL